MKRDYIRPLMEVEEIVVGGVLMDSPSPFPFPSPPGWSPGAQRQGTGIQI